MPVYVYKNLTTGETFEVEQRITEPAWTEHPETGDPLRRVIQPVGIAFKGSGFYVNDSRKSGSSSGGSSSKAQGSNDGGSSGGGSSDAKGSSTGSSDASSGGGSKDKAASGGSSSSKD